MQSFPIKYPILCVLFFFTLPGICLADNELVLSDALYDATGIELAGFAETRWGTRLQETSLEKNLSIGEARIQLDMTRDFDAFSLTLKSDLLADTVLNKIDLDLRDASLFFSPTDNVDIKLGRMVSTWGTGDLLFINDMFPKDWQSFFIGRDDEYLKQASNIIKTSVFMGDVALDIIYTPLFQGSEYVQGERLSYFNPMAGKLVGRNMLMDANTPDRYFTESEIAGRLSGQFGGIEFALYGYSGFWQEPEGFNPQTEKATYPRLNVWGASARSPLLGGIGTIEAGYYDSTHDDDGRDPFVRPSEYRFLAGFERELAQELTGGFQYYLEKIDNYTNYENSQSQDAHRRDEYRQMLTMRLTRLLMEQTLTLSFFVYYSPTDNDGYARPGFSYKLTDNWMLDGGGNLFWGEHEYTFWGRFQKNTNAYIGLRYSF